MRMQQRGGLKQQIQLVHAATRMRAGNTLVAPHSRQHICNGSRAQGGTIDDFEAVVGTEGDCVPIMQYLLCHLVPVDKNTRPVAAVFQLITASSRHNRGASAREATLLELQVIASIALAANQER